MKKIEISSKQVNQVSRLRRSGASWLKIQRQTGIPRRSAKRVYENWEKTQSIEDLKAARIQVASQDFLGHRERLINLADALVEHLPHRVMFDETRDADKVLDNLWMKEIGEKLQSLVSFQNKSEREQRRIVRQNQMLFESLKSHTREKVRWQALQEWKQAWNDCVRILPELRAEARKIVVNILHKQKSNVKDRIEKK